MKKLRIKPLVVLKYNKLKMNKTFWVNFRFIGSIFFAILRDLNK